jgi:hypothetical protein
LEVVLNGPAGAVARRVLPREHFLHAHVGGEGLITATQAVKGIGEQAQRDLALRPVQRVASQQALQASARDVEIALVHGDPGQRQDGERMVALQD